MNSSALSVRESLLIQSSALFVSDATVQKRFKSLLQGITVQSAEKVRRMTGTDMVAMNAKEMSFQGGALRLASLCRGTMKNQ
jgi:hypothetical protein